MSKWQAVSLSERSACQQHYLNLCVAPLPAQVRNQTHALDIAEKVLALTVARLLAIITWISEITE